MRYLISYIRCVFIVIGIAIIFKVNKINGGGVNAIINIFLIKVVTIALVRYTRVNNYTRINLKVF